MPVAFGFVATLFHGAVMDTAPVKPALWGRGLIIPGFCGFQLSRFDVHLNFHDMPQCFVQVIRTHDMQMLDAVRITPLQTMDNRGLVVAP